MQIFFHFVLKGRMYLFSCYSAVCFSMAFFMVILTFSKGVFGLGTTWDGLNLSPFIWVGLVPFDVWLEG